MNGKNQIETKQRSNYNKKRITSICKTIWDINKKKIWRYGWRVKEKANYIKRVDYNRFPNNICYPWKRIQKNKKYNKVRDYGAQEVDWRIMGNRMIKKLKRILHWWGKLNNFNWNAYRKIMWLKLFCPKTPTYIIKYNSSKRKINKSVPTVIKSNNN